MLRAQAPFIVNFRLSGQTMRKDINSMADLSMFAHQRRRAAL